MFRKYFNLIWCLSLQDFIQIQDGNLPQFLKRVIVFAAKHVQQCALCSQKGFICEICNSEKVIYPFDVELTVRVGENEICMIVILCLHQA